MGVNITGGLCECGCGQPAPLSPTTWRAEGYVAGQPRRFISGHNGRVRPKDPRSLWERIRSRCVRVGDCLVWQGCTIRGGYGQIVDNKKSIFVHRATWEHFNGPIPAGMEVDHVYAKGCRYTACCEPSHLEAVTPSENCKRRTKPTGRAAARLKRVGG